MSAIVVEKLGTAFTAMSNVKLTLSPSASVAVHVYSVLAKDTDGVPVTSWLALLTTPPGRAGSIE